MIKLRICGEIKRSWCDDTGGLMTYCDRTSELKDIWGSDSEPERFSKNGRRFAENSQNKLKISMFIPCSNKIHHCQLVVVCLHLFGYSASKFFNSRVWRWTHFEGFFLNVTLFLHHYSGTSNIGNISLIFTYWLYMLQLNHFIQQKTISDMTTTGGKRRSLLYLGNWFDLPEYSSDKGYNSYCTKSPNKKMSF